MTNLKQLSLLALFATLFATTLAIEIEANGHETDAESNALHGHFVVFNADKDSHLIAGKQRRGLFDQELRAKLAALEEENRALLSQSSQVQSQVNQAKGTHVRLSGENKALKETAGRLNGSFKEINELKLKSGEMDTLVSGYKYQIHRLGHVETENGSLKQALADLEGANGQMKARIVSLDDESNQLRIKIQEIETEVNTLGNLETQADELRNSIANKDVEIADLKAKIQANQKTEDDMNAQNAHDIEEIDTIINQKRNLVSELFSIKQLITVLETESDEIKCQSDIKDKDIDLYKKRSLNMSSEIENLKQLIYKLSLETSDREDLLKKIARLASEVRNIGGSEESSSDKFEGKDRKPKQTGLFVGKALHNK
jgi:chromosome segregation ATPase